MRGKGFIYRLRVVKCMVRMQGWKNGEGGIRCFHREVHGLFLFRANRGVTLVTRRISVRGWVEGWSNGVMREVECVRGM